MIGHIVLRKILMPCVVIKYTRNQNGVLPPLLSAYSSELCNDKDYVSLALNNKGNKRKTSKVGRVMADTYPLSKDSCGKTKLQLKIYSNCYQKTDRI